MSQIENKRSDELLEILAGKALGEMTPEESNRLSAIDPEVYADDLYELEITAATPSCNLFSCDAGGDAALLAAADSPASICRGRSMERFRQACPAKRRDRKYTVSRVDGNG